VTLSLALDAAAAHVKADRGQLGTVILELVANARDAMPGGGQVTISTSSVTLDAKEAGRYRDVKPGDFVLLEIRDKGHGMNADTRAHLFEPFFTTKEPGAGTGLGLATVYGIVTQSGGAITVDTVPEEGTTVRVLLPRAVETARVSAPVTLPRSLARPCETLLLVDDEEAVRMTLAAILEDAGYRVLEASSPKEALSIAGAFEGEIQLLVTDIMMPEMNGRELADRLEPLRPSMRVLFVSGYADKSLIEERILKAGAAFLAKPFAASALLRRLRELIEAAR
jgi:CheY-like chemotaxis protein